jgi:hypothetical protein
MPDRSGICLCVTRLTPAVGVGEHGGGGEMKSEVSGTSRRARRGRLAGTIAVEKNFSLVVRRTLGYDVCRQ